MRHNLKVPFAEKDEAKKLGARWDAVRKLWYIEGSLDKALFARWQPTQHDPAAAGVSTTPRRSASATRMSEGTLQVGNRFVVLPRMCDCLPWEDCEKCRLQMWPGPEGGH